MSEKKIGELIAYLVAEGCEDTAVVNLIEILDSLKLKEDKQYLGNLFESLERSGMLKIKYKKEDDFCISLLPKSKLFLKDKKEEEVLEKEIKITIPTRTIFLWSFFASFLASALVAIVAIILVKVL